jgi:hypothetical protein
MRKIAYALSQKPNSSYTEAREEYLVLRSKRGILEAERNPEMANQRMSPMKTREEMA